MRVPGKGVGMHRNAGVCIRVWGRRVAGLLTASASIPWVGASIPGMVLHRT